MRISFHLLPALALLLATAGCLEFADQTMTYRHDAKADALYIFQDYHGIFGADKPAGLSEEELEQFNSVLKTQRTFFFNNWITEFNREESLKTLAELRDPAKVIEKKMTVEAARSYETFLQLLVDNVRVENGPAYLDAKQRLSGVQKVTITRVSKILAAANAGIPYLLREEAQKDDTSTEQRALYLAAAARGGDFIRLEGNRFTVRWPMERADFDKQFGPAGNSAAQVAGFKQSGGDVVFSDTMVTWSFGRPGDRITSLTLPVSTKVYAPNGVEFARQHGRIRQQFDSVAGAKQFLTPKQ